MHFKEDKNPSLDWDIWQYKWKAVSLKMDKYLMEWQLLFISK